MNKLLCIAIGFFLMAGNHLTAQYWSTSAIKGEGEVVRQEITLPALKGIDLGFSGNVILTPGPVQQIILEGQQNILDLIKRDVVNGTWKIYFSKSVKDAHNVTVYITVPAIETVAMTGSGSVSSKGKFSGLNDLKLSLSGSGDINFDADARSVDAHVSGSGDIEVSGSAGALEVTISGSGDVRATSLSVNSCEVHISGSGDAEVDVNGNLDVYISGSGDVHYSGNPSVTAKVTGSGEVKNEK